MWERYLQRRVLQIGISAIRKHFWSLDWNRGRNGSWRTATRKQVNMLRLPKNMPTAFVCNCDLTAGLLVRKLTENGYRVPEDISVVGFDNYLYPGLSDIQITTYEVDMEEMAEKSVRKLICKISNENYKQGIPIVEGHIVLKESVAKI